MGYLEEQQQQQQQQQLQSQQQQQQSLYTQKRCIRCFKFYKEIENNYHLDTQQKPICFYQTNNNNQSYTVALADNGMRIVAPKQASVKALKHEEDLGYSAIVAKFPLHKDTIDILHHTYAKGVGLVGSSNDDVIERQEGEQNDDAFIVHRVAMTDTLIGISLYYQVKVEDIQRANKLDSHQIFHHKTLLIPRPDRPVVRPQPLPLEESKAQIIARKAKQIRIFRQMTTCNEDEARYYMELCNYHIERAISEWQKDCEWESNAKSEQQERLKQIQLRKRRSCC